MRETIINGRVFYLVREVTYHTKELLNRNAHKDIISGDDLDFIFDLIMNNYPNPRSKRLDIATAFFVKKIRGSNWLFALDTNGNEHDISYAKAIKNLKWNYIVGKIKEFNFGKHKGELITDVVKNDIQYINWMLKKNIFYGELKDVVISELENYNKGKTTINNKTNESIGYCIDDLY